MEETHFVIRKEEGKKKWKRLYTDVISSWIYEIDFTFNIDPLSDFLSYDLMYAGIKLAVVIPIQKLKTLKKMKIRIYYFIGSYFLSDLWKLFHFLYGVAGNDCYFVAILRSKLWSYYSLGAKPHMKLTICVRILWAL